MKLNRSLAALILLSFSSIAASQNISENAQKAVETLVNGHVAWSSKLTSPGASIQIKEIERNGSMIKYRLFVSGLPADKLFSVMAWPVTNQQPMVAMEGASIGKDGVVICAGRTSEQCGDSSKPDDPIDLVFNPAPGEPLRLGVVSGQNRATATIIPNPITGKDKDCTLAASRLLPHFELAYLTGSGFPANTTLTFESQSYGEKLPINSKSDADGNLRFVVLPAVKGHSAGTTTVRAVGITCSPTLKFEWGK